MQRTASHPRIAPPRARRRRPRLGPGVHGLQQRRWRPLVRPVRPALPGGAGLRVRADAARPHAARERARAGAWPGPFALASSRAGAAGPAPLRPRVGGLAVRLRLGGGDGAGPVPDHHPRRRRGGPRGPDHRPRRHLRRAGADRLRRARRHPGPAGAAAGRGAPEDRPRRQPHDDGGDQPALLDRGRLRGGRPRAEQDRRRLLGLHRGQRAPQLGRAQRQRPGRG